MPIYGIVILAFYGIGVFFAWGRLARRIIGDLAVMKVDVDDWVVGLFLGLMAAVIWPLLIVGLGIHKFFHIAPFRRAVTLWMGGEVKAS